MNAFTKGAPYAARPELTAPHADMAWSGDAAAAELLARDGRDARILWQGAIQPARIAFGCLVRPEPGDRVLVGPADGALWVLSVLERPSGAPPRLWAEGDLAIAARGDISLTAGQSVAIAAGATLQATAAEIDLHAGIARFVLDELIQVGRKASWYVGKLRSLGDVVETFAEHVLTRAQRASRFIAETDQMRAGDIDHRAEGTLQLQADLAFVTADTLVRVDAEQIHMG